MTTGHFVADRDRSLGRDVNLDHLQHATTKLIASFHAVQFSVTSIQRILDVGPLVLVNPFDLLLFALVLDLIQDVVDAENIRTLSNKLRVLAIGQGRSS